MEIKQCRVPLCENMQDISKDWPICTSCMFNTVRRFKRFLPNMSTEDITAMVIRDINRLVGLEQKVIDERGTDYDRDKE